MKRPAAAPLLAALAIFAAMASNAARAADTLLPSDITFATSSGYWEDDGTAANTLLTPATQPPPVQPTIKPVTRHGYYKLFAVRQPDRTSKVYLQQISVADDGLQVLSTIELRELGELKPYVTDIRPENPDGFIKEPGFFATVVLKTDPDGDAERWTVAVDEFGEITVEKPSN